MTTLPRRAVSGCGLRARPLLPGHVTGQVDGVLIDEVARRRVSAVACSVGFAGTFDPQVGVGVRARCRRAVGGVPSARPLGLHQLSGESGAGPAPLRDVSIT